jgi:hypothetical protein
LEGLYYVFRIGAKGNPCSCDCDCPDNNTNVCNELSTLTYISIPFLNNRKYTYSFKKDLNNNVYFCYSTYPISIEWKFNDKRYFYQSDYLNSSVESLSCNCIPLLIKENDIKSLLFENCFINNEFFSVLPIFIFDEFIIKSIINKLQNCNAYEYLISGILNCTITIDDLPVDLYFDNTCGITGTEYYYLINYINVCSVSNNRKSVKKWWN